ncbi:sensor histidine kinase [Rubinisphaera italica]|uniref:histidine kinase n=1 Tax=Rubinisphaera italica TaxID=2527969 RepID=A0A5C5XGM0_9PLAN|nr:HAMP domain-containing sensor histidine kinase [Rubinisphaera italica]TWT61849.1 Sensor protein ZraS [Rubinisphaera italica]
MNSKQETISIHPDDARMASLVEFCAAAGHEINNPLAVILGRVHLLLKDEHDPARRQSLETIAGQALRVRDMIGDVMVFADPPSPQPSRFVVHDEISKIIESQLAIARRQFGDEVPQIKFDCSEEIILEADRDQFLTVISELIRNTLHPSTAATSIQIEILEADDQCEIHVTDDGRGLTPEEMQHLFDPFYSGRQAGRGLGFGLSKAYRLAELHQATIEVIQIPETHGLQLVVIWPLAVGEPSQS